MSSYYEFINEQYEKKREAVLEYTEGDRAKTTGFLDTHTECMCLLIYEQWLRNIRGEAREEGNG